MSRARDLADYVSTGVTSDELNLLDGSDTGPLSHRNMVANGDMRIDQRNVGSSTTPTHEAYTLDRMKWGMTQTSKFTVQQVSDAPADFQKSLKVTSSSAYSILSTDYFFLDYVVEGNMMEHLNWGTSDAKTVTLSFWVKSSLTGTFGGTVLNAGALKNYVFSYTIDSANTWEKKEITIEGETTSTWGTGTSAGMYLRISIGAGSGTTGTAGSWGSLYRSVTGQTNVLGTSGATWQVTGVQLEIGSVATPFEHRSYGDELQRCQRYYEKLNGAGESGNYAGFGAGYSNGTTGLIIVSMRTPKRATPTFTHGGSFRLLSASGSTSFSFSADFYIDKSGNGYINVASFGASTGTGYGIAVTANNDANAYFAFDAEL